MLLPRHKRKAVAGAASDLDALWGSLRCNDGIVSPYPGNSDIGG